MLPARLTKRLVNHSRPQDVTEGYAAGWILDHLRAAAERIADRIGELIRSSGPVRATWGRERGRRRRRVGNWFDANRGIGYISRAPNTADSIECRRSRTEIAMYRTEIIFEVNEDEIDGGYSANALGFGIHTQGDTLDELRRNVREAVDCYFYENMERPRLIRLHYVRDEVLLA